MTSFSGKVKKIFKPLIEIVPVIISITEIVVGSIVLYYNQRIQDNCYYIWEFCMVDVISAPFCLVSFNKCVEFIKYTKCVKTEVINMYKNLTSKLVLILFPVMTFWGAHIRNNISDSCIEHYDSYYSLWKFYSIIVWACLIIFWVMIFNVFMSFVFFIFSDVDD